MIIVCGVIRGDGRVASGDKIRPKRFNLRGESCRQSTVNFKRPGSMKVMEPY